jgi:hypothetical protein
MNKKLHKHILLRNIVRSGKNLYNRFIFNYLIKIPD